MRSGSETSTGKSSALLNMKETIKPAHYFMSANTASGFLSRFGQLYDAKTGWKAYILKGTPGTASMLLPRAGEKFENAGISVEYIHCVSNPSEISAIVLPEEKICFTDGLPPHCINPKFPGIVEIEITLSDCDCEKLNSDRGKILQFAARASALYDRAYRYISAASSLQSDSTRIAGEYFDAEAVRKYARGLARRLFPAKGCQGRSVMRYLSGITADGEIFFYNRDMASYERIYNISDDYGLSRSLISILREKAKAAGYNVISCECPISGSPEHLLIPEISTAFVTSNNYHKAEGKPCRHVNIRRFLDCDSLRLKRARIGFNRKAAKELYDQAALLLKEAKADDDIIRECYTPCIDIDKAWEKLSDTISKILSPRKLPVSEQKGT